MTSGSDGRAERGDGVRSHRIGVSEPLPSAAPRDGADAALDAPLQHGLRNAVVDRGRARAVLLAAHRWRCDRRRSGCGLDGEAPAAGLLEALGACVRRIAPMRDGEAVTSTHPLPHGDRGYAVAGGVTMYRRRTFALLRSLIISAGG